MRIVSKRFVRTSHLQAVWPESHIQWVLSKVSVVHALHLRKSRKHLSESTDHLVCATNNNFAMRNLLQWQRYQLRNCRACPSSSFNLCHISRFTFIPHFFLSRSYETPERTIYDESGMGYTESHIDSRLECSETQSGGTSCIQMKTEPLGGPSSPESTSETNANPDDCAGCGRSIQVSWASQQ